MQLTVQSGGNQKPHAEGIFPAACVDVIDMGEQRVEFQGKTKMVPKVRLVFETMELKDDGTRWTLARTFTASLHPKSKLAGVVEKWRGRPLVEGEVLDLRKMIGASAMLLVSHVVRSDGMTVAMVDAISKPTTKVTPSGKYDPAVARARLVERGALKTDTKPSHPVRGGSHEQRTWNPEPAAEPVSVQVVEEEEVAAHF